MDSEISYDNRETCVNPVPSACIPYTGKIADSIKTSLPECKPNINDVIDAMQKLIDKINLDLGDNKTLNKSCLTFTPLTVKQVELNQLFINELCTIKTQLAAISGDTVDPSTLMVAVNLLCLADPSCVVSATYSLQTILTKLIVAYCNLLTRVASIETILNI